MEGTGEFKDITYYNPSLANAAGDMISNADDLNKFFSSLLGGKLLKERELKEMLTTVPIEGKGLVTHTVLESMRLNFQTVFQFGAWRRNSWICNFCWGVIGGKHTLAISLNSIGGVDIVPQLNKMMQIEFNK